VLTQHDKLVKQPSQQSLPENVIVMTTLAYHYLLDAQYNNLFQLLSSTKNIEL
jgi:hypothetical protein